MPLFICIRLSLCYYLYTLALSIFFNSLKCIVSTIVIVIFSFFRFLFILYFILIRCVSCKLLFLVFFDVVVLFYASLCRFCTGVLYIPTCVCILVCNFRLMINLVYPFLSFFSSIFVLLDYWFGYIDVLYYLLI